MLYGKGRTSPATLRNQQQSTTKSDDSYKKQCGARDTNPTLTTKANKTEAASLHAYLLVTVRSHTLAKASKSAHISGMYTGM